jgi:hypothetical protein
LVEAEVNATTFPSAEIDGYTLLLFPERPDPEVLILIVEFVLRSLR